MTEYIVTLPNIDDPKPPEVCLAHLPSISQSYWCSPKRIEAYTCVFSCCCSGPHGVLGPHSNSEGPEQLTIIRNHELPRAGLDTYSPEDYALTEKRPLSKRGA